MTHRGSKHVAGWLIFMKLFFWWFLICFYLCMFCWRCGTWIRGWINCDCSVVHKDCILLGTDCYLNIFSSLLFASFMRRSVSAVSVQSSLPVTLCVSRLARLVSSAVVPVLLQKASCQHVKKSTKVESYRILFTILKILGKDLTWVFLN